MNLFDRLRRKVAPDNLLVRMTTNVELGHGMAAVLCKCAACGEKWREIIPFYAVIQDCPHCGARENVAVQPVVVDSLGLACDGPWLEGAPVVDIIAVSWPR